MTTIKFTRTGDSDLSLISTSGIEIEWNTWAPRIAEPGQYVRDTFKAIVHGSSADNLASTLQSLRAYQRRAEEYHRQANTTGDPVWLQAQTDNETGARRCHVRRIQWRALQYPGDGLTFGTNKDDVIRIEITIEHGVWERTATRTMATGSSLSGACITYDPTDTASPYDTAGDDPARVNFFQITAGAAIDRVWIGARSSILHDELADFEPIWELEDGTNNGALSSDDTTTETNLASPGGGSGAYVHTTSSSNDVWERALSITMADAVTHSSPNEEYNSNLGQFLWMLRSKVSAGTYQVHLRFGYTGMEQNNMYRTDPVEITHTNWDYTAVDVVDIPFGAEYINPNLWTLLDDLEIEVWVKRTDGSGDIELDCLVPLPIDEGYLIAENLSLTATDLMYRYESADGNVRVLGYDGTSFSTDAVFDEEAFALPVGDARYYIIIARASQSVLTDDIAVANSTFYERWSLMRGGE